MLKVESALDIMNRQKGLSEKIKDFRKANAEKARLIQLEKITAGQSESTPPTTSGVTTPSAPTTPLL